jgi:uncharacterized linocin/CFP29 family protein
MSNTPTHHHHGHGHGQHHDGQMGADHGVHPGQQPMVHPSHDGHVDGHHGGLAGGPGGQAHPGAPAGHPGAMPPHLTFRAGVGHGKQHAGSKHGRDKIDWSPEVWKRIDAAVKEEITRARVAAKFLPTIHVPAKTTTAPADLVGRSTLADSAEGALTVDESATTRISEFWVEFALTPAQMEEEEHAEREMGNGHGASTGITLATRAANILAQVEDSIIFQGRSALDGILFAGAPGATPPWPSAVNFRGRRTDLDLGLLNILLDDDSASSLPSWLNALLATVPSPTSPQPGQVLLPGDQVIQVLAKGTSAATGQPLYQENTVAAVAQGFSVLQSKGQYGPYALVLQTTPFADAHSPLPTTLITPAEPIRHLMTAGFFGTGTLPPYAPSGISGTSGTMTGLPSTPAGVLYTGVMVSLGGNTMDLVRGRMQDEEDVIVRFEQKDVDGNYRFRVLERFALRLKDLTSVVLLEFMRPTV